MKRIQRKAYCFWRMRNNLWAFIKRPMAYKGADLQGDRTNEGELAGWSPVLQQWPVRCPFLAFHWILALEERTGAVIRWEKSKQIIQLEKSLVCWGTGKDTPMCLQGGKETGRIERLLWSLLHSLLSLTPNSFYFSTLQVTPEVFVQKTSYKTALGHAQQLSG